MKKITKLPLFALLLLFSFKGHSQILYDNGGLIHNDNNISPLFELDGRSWDHNNLTYFFENGTSDIAGDEEKDAIKQAMNLWESYSSLIFTEVTSSLNADIIIKWGTFNHGDNSSFDGTGSVLAHAFYPPPNGPYAGDLHFDDDESWTLNTRNSDSQPIDLVTVALHELGHSLGLKHSSVSGAVMNAQYNGSHRYLSNDDILAIQELYPPIEITGPSEICYNDTTNYTINPTSITATAWNVSPNLDILSQNQNSITVKPTTTSNNGVGYIEAIFPSETVRKDILIGKPRLLVAKFDNGQYMSHGFTNIVCKSELMKTDISVDGAETVSWSLINSSHTTTWSQSGNNLTFYLWASPNHTATFKLSLNNDCGTFTRYYSFESENCSGGNDPCGPTMEISQNPVDTEIEIINIPAPCDPVISKSENKDKLLQNSSATLYDFTGNPVLSQSPAEGAMNVEKLKSGNYFLIILKNNKKESYRIIIE